MGDQTKDLKLKLIALISDNLPNMSPRQMQALINDPIRLQAALQKALCPDRMIDLTTHGRSGEQCIAYLEKKRYNISVLGRELLYSEKFVVTNGVTYTLAVIIGREFKNAVRTNRNIRAEALKRGYLEPPVEVAPYLRELVSDRDLKEMGLSALIVMHEPITNSHGALEVFSISRHDKGYWLDASPGNPDYAWSYEYGFAFLVPISS